MALAWTAALTLTLLQSGANPVVGPSLPQEPAKIESEIALTVAHIIGFGGLTLFWAFAFDETLRSRRAILLAVGIALAFGLGTETLQGLTPDRRATLWDYFTNTVSIFAVGVYLRRRFSL